MSRKMNSKTLLYLNRMSLAITLLLTNPNLRSTIPMMPILAFRVKDVNFQRFNEKFNHTTVGQLLKFHCFRSTNLIKEYRVAFFLKNLRWWKTSFGGSVSRLLKIPQSGLVFLPAWQSMIARHKRFVTYLKSILRPRHTPLYEILYAVRANGRILLPLFQKYSSSDIELCIDSVYHVSSVVTNRRKNSFGLRFK